MEWLAKWRRSWLLVEGIGTDTAASLLIAVGENPERLKSEAAFAHLCGAAPIPASWGKSVRHLV